MSTFDHPVSFLPGFGEGLELLAGSTTEVLAANHLLDSMIEHIPTAVYMKDAAQLRYVRINRAAEALFGMSREQMIGKSAHEVFEKDEADVFVAQDRQVLARGIVEDIPEQRYSSRSKGLRLLHVRKVPVFGEGGEPTHILGISEDVTQQKEMEKEILSLNSVLKAHVEDLEASNKSLESFTSAATHDLRSPLSVIGGYAGLLEQNYASRLDEKGQRYVSVIRRSINSMAKLIDDLLAFSKLGQREVSKASVDMHGLARRVIEEMLQLHPEGKKPDIQLGSLPPAQADAALLHQVWVNLLSNAVKYSSRAVSPLIEVSGRMEGTEAIYSVRDNGAGFSMDHYDKLFEMFQRLHTDEEFEGTGVGLPIVHRVVTRHGGRVWAEGKVGQGAAFHFALPV
ncbi:sensor histidine kinase [Polaromonas sp.]|uniref:sensor histidine kinase n=1 Tax=Polaromonas sp. TaxID=1869339 RepID=UPI002FC6E5F3